MYTIARYRTMEPSGLKTEQKTPHCVTDFKEIPFSIQRSMTLLPLGNSPTATVGPRTGQLEDVGKVVIRFQVCLPG